MTRDSKSILSHRQNFIGAMRNVVASVSVVTTDGPAGRHGATVSAFCSVSADPPSVLVCLKADSRIARLVAGNGTFTVNVLPEGASAIARRFAGALDDRLSDRFEGLVDLATGPCVLPGTTAFICDVTQTTPSGSHLIYIGEVREISRGATAPLAYLDGAYHRLVRSAAEPKGATS